MFRMVVLPCHEPRGIHQLVNPWLAGAGTPDHETDSLKLSTLSRKGMDTGFATEKQCGYLTVKGVSPLLVE